MKRTSTVIFCLTSLHSGTTYRPVPVSSILFSSCFLSIFLLLCFTLFFMFPTIRVKRRDQRCFATRYLQKRNTLNLAKGRADSVTPQSLGRVASTVLRACRVKCTSWKQSEVQEDRKRYDKCVLIYSYRKCL